MLIGLFRYGFVVTGDFFLWPLGCWGHLFDFIHYGFRIICLSWIFLNVASHIVQSVTCSRTFTTLIGHDLFRIFCYHMAF